MIRQTEFLFKLKKKKTQPNCLLAFDIETINDVVNAVPYTAGSHPARALWMKWGCQLTNEEFEN